MANEEDALLRQIDEEVRRERLARLWDKYGVIVLTVVGAILLMFGGWRLYQSEAIKAARQAGAQFTEASQLIAEKEKQDDGLRALQKMAKSGPEGYSLLAKLKLAALARSEDKNGEAEQHYQAVADDTAADPLFRSFARLQIASLKLDEGSFTDVKNQLNDLIKDGNPWRHSAREIFGLAALKAGKYSEARDTFRALLTDKDVPRTISQRAHIAMAMIAREELKAKTAKSEKAAQPKVEPSDKSPETTPAPAKSEPEKTDGTATPPNATSN